MSRRNYGMWNGCHSDKQTTSEIYDRERSKARWFLIYWRVRLLVSTDHPRQKPYSACDQEHRTQIYSALPAGTWRNNNIITSKTSRRRFGVTMTLLLHHVPTGLYVDEIWIQRERIGLNLTRVTLLPGAPFNRWFDFNPIRISITSIIRYWVKLLLHSYTSTVAPLKFGNG